MGLVDEGVFLLLGLKQGERDKERESDVRCKSVRFKRKLKEKGIAARQTKGEGNKSIQCNRNIWTDVDI